MKTIPVLDLHHPEVTDEDDGLLSRERVFREKPLTIHQAYTVSTFEIKGEITLVNDISDESKYFPHGYPVSPREFPGFFGTHLQVS
jgi:hypothetical protein